MKEPDRYFTPMTVEDAVTYLREVSAWNRAHPVRDDKIFTMFSTELLLEMCERLLALTERKPSKEATVVSTGGRANQHSEIVMLKQEVAKWKACAIEGWTTVTGNEVTGRQMAQEMYDRS